MAEKTVYDLLGVNVDSQETKFLEATAVYSLKSAGPDGEIVFDSNETLIPGFVADSSSFALTASFANTANTANTAISSSYALTASFVNGAVASASYAISASHAVSSSYAITSSFVTGTVTSASYAITASYAGTATSASYTSTASVALNISASSINSSTSETYDSSNNASINWDIRRLLDSSANASLSWEDRILVTNTSATTVDWQLQKLTDEIGFDSIDWKKRKIYAEDGTVVIDYLMTSSGVIMSSSLTVGKITSTPSNENTLSVYPPQAGGTGEGGQILLAASGGIYTSASMLDTWQDQFRVLRGSNTGGSNAGLMYMNLQSGNTQFVGTVTASAYNGLPNDYLYVTRNTTQTVGSSWANTDIIFNNTVVSKGISYNTGTGLASLTGGKVYRITARLAWGAAAAYNLQYSCYTSANTQIGPTVEIIQSTNGTNNISDGTLEFIYAPGSNTDIKIRTTGANTALSGETIRGDLNTQLIIQQIA